MLKDIEELRKEQGRLCDDVSEIETECDLLAKKIEVIDNTIEKINKQIDAYDKLNDTEEFERNQSRVDNMGYCRQSESCNFFHAPRICILRNWKMLAKMLSSETSQSMSLQKRKIVSLLALNDSCDSCNEFSQNIYYFWEHFT